MRARARHEAPAPGTRIHGGIDELGRAEWDRLVGADNFYSSHRWLRSVHLGGAADPVITARDSGRLLGALVTWPGDRDDPLFAFPSLLPGLAADPGEYLWLGTRRSTSNELVCVRGPLRRPTLRTLLGRALELAEHRGATGVVMPYLAGIDALELAAAHPRARALLHSADTYLPVPFGGPYELAARATHADRTRRRNELRALQRSGTTVETTPLTPELIDPVASLIAQNRARHGSAGGPETVRAALRAQHAAGLLDDATAFLGRRGSDLVAVSVCYQHADRLYARYFGFDYARAEPACEYFVLVYHAPVEYAAQAGLRRYRLAISAWDVKIRRGARLTPLAAVVLPVRGAVCDTARQRLFNREAARHWRGLAATRPDALDPDWDSWDDPLN